MQSCEIGPMGLGVVMAALLAGKLHTCILGPIQPKPGHTSFPKTNHTILLYEQLWGLLFG
jgi:hypothetical protein